MTKKRIVAEGDRQDVAELEQIQQDILEDLGAFWMLLEDSDLPYPECVSRMKDLQSVCNKKLREGTVSFQKEIAAYQAIQQHDAEMKKAKKGRKA